jgi:hypothetical protein
MVDVLIMILMSVRMEGIWLCKFLYCHCCFVEESLMGTQRSVRAAVLCSAAQGSGDQSF